MFQKLLYVLANNWFEIATLSIALIGAIPFIRNFFKKDIKLSANIYARFYIYARKVDKYFIELAIENKGQKDFWFHKCEIIGNGSYLVNNNIGDSSYLKRDSFYAKHVKNNNIEYTKATDLSPRNILNHDQILKKGEHLFYLILVDNGVVNFLCKTSKENIYIRFYSNSNQIQNIKIKNDILEKLIDINTAKKYNPFN